MSGGPRPRLAAIAAAQAAAAGALALATWAPVNGTAFTVAALAFAAAGVLHLELELPRGRCTVTPSQAVLVVAVAFLPVAGVAAAAAVGEAASLAVRRVEGFKIAYNACGRALAAALATATYAALAPDPSGLQRWIPGLVAAAVFSVANLVSTSAALALVERRSLYTVVANAAPTAMLSASMAAPLGLVAHELAASAPLAPLVLLPVVAGFALNARAAVRGRVEHELVAQLYAAMHETAPLRAADEAARVAAARSMDVLVALGAAVVWRAQGEGARAVAAGDAGVDDPDAALREVAALVPVGSARSVDLPGIGDGVLAARASGGGVEVVVLAWRRPGLDRIPLAAEPAATALAANAALALQNACLLDQVERSLATEIDLNRKKGEFVAAVSHELRTPLTALVGLVDTVRRHAVVLDSEQWRSFLGQALEQGDKLNALIGDLLDVAAAERAEITVKPVALDATDLLADVRRTVRVTDHGRVEFAPVSSPCPLSTDRDKAARVLLNLVDNALKYSEGRVRVGVEHDAKGVTFAVDDEGPGVTAADAERIFEAFVQLDQSTTRARGGTGLGLHLCRQLSSALGGTVELGASPLGGARFAFRLPIASHERHEDDHELCTHR